MVFEDIGPAAAETTQTSQSVRMENSSNDRRRMTNRKRYASYGVIGAILLVVAVLVMIFLFRVSEFRAAGNDGVYTNVQIVEAANPGGYVNYLFINSDKIVRRLETALPYLDGVTLTKERKDRSVTVNVSYTSAAFAAEYENSYVLMNENCKVLETGRSAVPDGLTQVTGVGLASSEAGKAANFVNENMREYIVSVFRALRRAKIAGIVSCDFTDTRDVRVYLSDKGEIQLGDVSELDEMKIAYLAKLYEIRQSEGDDEAYVIYLLDAVRGYIGPRDAGDEETLGWEVVTDENGEPVTNEDGEAETVLTGEEPATAEEPEETTAAMSALEEFLSRMENEETTEAPAQTSAPEETATEAAEENGETTKSALDDFYNNLD